MRQWTVFGIAALVLVVGGCTTQERSVSPAVIRFDTPGYTKIALAKIFRNDAHVGWLETIRIADGNSDDADDRHLMYVRDVHLRKVGWIEDNNLAFRIRAWEGRYSGKDSVSLSSDIGVNILAIFDWTDGEIRVEQLEAPN